MWLGLRKVVNHSSDTLVSRLATLLHVCWRPVPRTQFIAFDNHGPVPRLREWPLGRFTFAKVFRLSSGTNFSHALIYLMTTDTDLALFFLKKNKNCPKASEHFVLGHLRSQFFFAKNFLQKKTQLRAWSHFTQIVKTLRMICILTYFDQIWPWGHLRSRDMRSNSELDL